MKKIIKNKYANFYLNAAEKFGLEYKIINEKIGLIRIFNEEQKLDISSNVLGVNTQLGASLSTNKVKTSTLLQEENIPVPAFKTFKDTEKATAYAMEQLKLNKSVVVKPISGSLSIGITVNPSREKQVRKAVIEAFLEGSTIMIERYIEGKHFRITVLDDEVMAITERIASNVTGDGKSTLVELIKKKNTSRGKLNLPLISLRDKDIDYLKSQKIDLEKVYPTGINIILQLGCDLDIGGERVRIERETIPQVNLNLFVRAVKKLSLRFAGIDYITPNITTPYTQIRSAINEINSAPDSDVHYRDMRPGNNYAAERIIAKLFSSSIKIAKKKHEPLFNASTPIIVPISA